MDKEIMYQAIVDSLYDGVYVVDPKRRIVFWNRAAENITGYKKEEVVGNFCQSNLLNHIDKEGRPLCIVGCPLYATLGDGEVREEEVFLRHREGHRVPVMTRVIPLYTDGKISGAIEIFSPSSPKVYEDDLVGSLTDMAMKDQLTGLPNRRYLESFLEYKLNEFQRFGARFCVLFFDVDNFGSFNNSYGHDVGDKVLINISNTLQHSLRKSDIMGRWGGEEFVGVFRIQDNQDLFEIGDKVRVLISSSEVRHGNRILSVTASVGVTLVREDDTVDSVVKRADQLMYQSKQAGKNRVTAG